MARPPIGDKPILARKSNTVPSERVKKAPSKKVIQYYAPLVEACVALVLSNVERDSNWNIVGKKAISISFKSRKERPKWMPVGSWTSKGDMCIMSINAEMMLTVLYEQRLTEYYPSMIYKSRGHIVESIDADLLKEFDIKFDID